MAKKKKQARRNREKRRQKKATKPRRTTPPAASARRFVEPAPPTLWPEPEGLTDPIFLAADGRVVPDPHAVLGLEPGTLDVDAIQTAFREAIVAHPPEREPERAREIREARDRLVDPERFLERELLVVRPLEPRTAGGAEESRLDAEARLVGQAVLYALVEDALGQTS